jgi:hypothetical protein
MTVLLLVLAGWAVISIPVALLVSVLRHGIRRR